MQPGERAREAAVRELNEELGLAIESCWLEDPWTITKQQRGGRNTVTIFTVPWVQVACAPRTRSRHPALTIDQLEIVSTAWMSPDEALKEHLPGHLRHYFEINGSESMALEPAYIRSSRR